MKSNAKSSITLPPEELRLVNGLMKRLRARSKVEVVRRGLVLLKETTDRAALREAYAQASRAVRASTATALRDLDPLAGEGLEEDEGSSPTNRHESETGWTLLDRPGKAKEPAPIRFNYGPPSGNQAARWRAQNP